MKSLKIILAGLTGTTAMTFFSYAAARIRGKKFEEPVLLNQLIRRLPASTEKIGSKHSSAGWLLHYSVGISFSALFSQVWAQTEVKPKYYIGAWLGALAGVVGITVWKITFKLHPNPPETHFKQYYLQLLIAHIIFGIFSALGYRQPVLTLHKEEHNSK